MNGQFIPRQQIHNIQEIQPLSDVARTRLWLVRDYATALRQHAEAADKGDDPDIESIMQAKSERYGEITIRPNIDRPWFYSDQLGLFQAVN